MQITAKIGTRISQYNVDDCCAKVVEAIPAKLSSSIAKNGSSRPKVANQSEVRGAGKGASDCGALKEILSWPTAKEVYIAIAEQCEANLASGGQSIPRQREARSHPGRYLKDVLGQHRVALRPPQRSSGRRSPPGAIAHDIIEIHALVAADVIAARRRKA